MSILDPAMELEMTPQSRRSGGVAVESEARRGGDGFGRIAMGWLRVRGGLFVERVRRVEAEGSWMYAGDGGE